MTPFEPFERSHSVGQKIDMRLARFAIGDVVRHKIFDFRGVVFDVDPFFANSEEWYEFDPGGAATVQGPALLPLTRRECGVDLRRLRQPAEPGGGRERRAGRASRYFSDVRRHGRRQVPAPSRTPALIAPSASVLELASKSRQEPDGLRAKARLDRRREFTPRLHQRRARLTPAAPCHRRLAFPRLS